MVARLFFIHMKNYLLLLTLLCLSLSARAHDAEVDGIFYNLDAANKTATVTFQGDDAFSYDNEYSGDVVIPETVTYGDITYSVTSLGSFCFAGCSSLTSITIPNSVTSLGSSCFRGCSSLTSIYMLPSTPPSTGSKIFDNTPLETVYVMDEDAKTAYQPQVPWSEYTALTLL